MFKHIYIHNRLYVLIAVLIVLYILAFPFPVVWNLAHGFGVLIFITLICDYIILNRYQSGVIMERQIVDRLSLGDTQEVIYTLINENDEAIHFELVDELPYQLQYRSSIGSVIAKPGKNEFSFNIRPVLRGAYQFGKCYAYISSSKVKLLQWKKRFDLDKEVEVYPSIIQMKKYELEVFARTATMRGIRRFRQLGENDEFERIRAFAQGDNIRAINWKATSRMNGIMINQFQNTRSQNVYCIVDKGRAMKMPFNDLTLLDYAINSTLVLSNIVLKKFDRIGLVSFSDKIGTRLKAASRSSQLELILRQLYNEKTGFKESNFELLYYSLRSVLNRRSILLFFTNFENDYDLQRHLPYLRSLNKSHLLIVIFFSNTELEDASQRDVENLDDIYFNTFANKSLVEKSKLKMKLNANGIQTILTKPEDLSVNVINKYLEIKSKRKS